MKKTLVASFIFIALLTTQVSGQDELLKTADLNVSMPDAPESISNKKPTIEPAHSATKKRLPSKKPEKIQFNFENTHLQNLIDWMAHVQGITFLTDDAIKTSKTKPLIGNTKISFQTNKPLTKAQAWNTFVAFLDMAGLAVVPGPESDFFKITMKQNALKSALPTFIGTDPKELPNNDSYIRYVYFLENTSKGMLKDLVTLLKTFMMQPKNANISTFAELTALIFTEKSINIKSIMEIVQQLDKATSPEVLRIIPLKHTNAQEVVQLYKALAAADDPTKRPFPGQKKEPSLFYFPEDAKLVAESRTNTLIILGPKKAVDRIEEFVRVHVDKQLPKADSMLQVYPLQYANAVQVSDILNKVTNFDPRSEAQKYGSIIDGSKYFKKIKFTADESTNSIVARADKQDWQYIIPVIKKLDTIQPQVAIEVLIVRVENIKNKQLGMQFRNKDKHLLGNNTNFQTSGLPTGGTAKAPLVDSISGSLMANLIGLATGHQPGTTLLTFGAANNIWGILKFLETHTQTNVISSPFLITTNKYEASVILGRTKRVVTGTVVSGAEGNNVQTRDDLPANLSVKITPLINQDDVITLNIDIDIEDFVNPDDAADTTRLQRKVVTTATLLNGEVLALGGLMQKKVVNKQSQVPLLGRIPVLGWLFKNKSKEDEKENLLIFISPRIIRPDEKLAHDYTINKAAYVNDVIQGMTQPSDKRDPIYKWFFAEDPLADVEVTVNDFINKGSIGFTEPEKISVFEKKAHTPHSKPDVIKMVGMSPQPKKRTSLVSFMKEDDA